MIDVLLTYEKGLDKHYGLIELAEQSGVFKKVSTRYEMLMALKYSASL